MNTRESGYGRQVGNGPMRYFTVTFTEDSSERAEAVRFFSQHALLREASPLPRKIDMMTNTEAQEYLDSHPVQKRWSILNTATEQILNDDFTRIRFLPELARVYLYGVGNTAIEHLSVLTYLIDLVVYSEHVDDACLIHIARLSSLESLDFQASPHVSTFGFEKTVGMLPSLKDWYSPHRKMG